MGGLRRLISRKTRGAGAAYEQQNHRNSNDAFASISSIGTALPEHVEAQAPVVTSSSPSHPTSQPNSVPAPIPAGIQSQPYSASGPSRAVVASTSHSVQHGQRHDGALLDAIVSKKDYWQLAIQQLQKEDSSIAEQIAGVHEAIDKTEHTDLATLLLHATERSHQALKAKRWKIKIGSGEIELREQFERLIKMFLLFQDVGNAATSIDPLHARLPLAGFCVLMQNLMTISDSEQYANMVIGVEKIVTIVARYREIELRYRSRAETKLKQEFEKCLVSLYKHIIRYQISATCYYRRSTMKRFLRSIPRLDDVSERLKTIQQGDNDCKDIVQVFDSSDARDERKEISQKIDGLSKHLIEGQTPGSPTPATQQHWGVARPSNALFTGREDVLQDLETIVRNSLKDSERQSSCQIVISGVGGQGKSEICLQLVHQVWPVLWGVFWVDVSTENSAENDFLDVARRLNVPARTWEDACRGLANLKHPWLLVLDNADDPNVDYQRYFPAGPSGVVILTSRSHHCQQYGTTKYVPLEGLSEVAACELLFKAAKIADDDRPTLRDNAHKVAVLLKSHPLALIQAGAYVGKGHCTFSEYPCVYSQQRKRLLKFRPNQAQSRYGDVYTTFEASAAALHATDSEAAQDALVLLPILAAYGSSRLPLPLFQGAWMGARRVSLDVSSNTTDDGALPRLTPWHVTHLPSLIPTGPKMWDNFRLVEAVDLLKAFSLVSTDNYDVYPSVSMHGLVHAWARDRQNTSEQHVAWLGAGTLVALSADEDLFWTRQARQLQSHLQAVTSWEMSTIFGSEPPQMIVYALTRCGWLLRKMRDDAILFALLQRLFTHLDLDRLTVDTNWLALYELSAINLFDYGKIKEAVAVLEELVRIKTQTLAEDHPDILLSQHQLAGAYYLNGQVKKAVAVLEELVRIKTQVLAEDRPSRLASQHQLAGAYVANGEVKKAVVLLEEVVRIRTQTLAEDHPDRLASQHQLAGAYQANGQVKKAAVLLEEVVRIQAQTLAEDHPDRLASQHQLAGAYQANGLVKKAAVLLEEVVRIKTQTLAEDHPDRLASQNNLALYFWALGRRQEALEMMRHVVRTWKHVSDEHHPERVKSEDWLKILEREMESESSEDRLENVEQEVENCKSSGGIQP